MTFQGDCSDGIFDFLRIGITFDTNVRTHNLLTHVRIYCCVFHYILFWHRNNVFFLSMRVGRHSACRGLHCEFEYIWLCRTYLISVRVLSNSNESIKIISRIKFKACLVCFAQILFAVQSFSYLRPQTKHLFPSEI